MFKTKTKTINNVEKHYMINTFDEMALKQAESIFLEYCKKGVVLNKNFSDDKWKVTNQVHTILLNFSFNEALFYTNTKPWIGCQINAFSKNIKTYIVFLLGELGLFTLGEIVRSFHHLIEKSYEQLVQDGEYFSEHVRELLRQFPDNYEIRDIVLEALDETACRTSWKRNARKKRLLADFNAYFSFNDALQEFWDNADLQKKQHYFPLRLWWTLTSILPLRPTEFLLIPRDCLELDNDKYILTVRRTAQKGGNNRVSYRIDEDYTLSKYSIPKQMAAEILEYKKSIGNMPLSKLDTLFLPLPGSPSSKRNKACEYYNYLSLINCLKRFQYEVMMLPENSDKLINLGDTRHIAMISLIISGGSPVICKELAGHRDINISSHYYSNISKFIECATYDTYRKRMGSTATMRNHRSKNLKESAVKINGGYCDSPKYYDGDIEDCIKHMGSDGEIGYCPECPYFIDGKHGMYIVFANPEERKKQVDEDGRLLMEALDSVRKGIGCNEDIQAALLRLQYSSTWYSRCLQNELEVN